MNDKKMIKDTFILAFVQIFLEILAMILNMLITDRLGASATGITSLANSFFGFASVIAGGNIFVCMSRFAAEEIGKKQGNPSGVLTYGTFFCIILSILTSLIIFIFGAEAGEYFLKTSDSVVSVRLLALCLPLSSITSCMKGYFNAYRKTMTVAVSNIAEFVSRSLVMLFLVETFTKKGSISIFTSVALSILSGEIISFIFLISVFHTVPHNYGTRKIKGFSDFVKKAVPLTFNSYITVILGSVNEMLLPFTLKQYGHSTQEALGQYGILETVVMPLLYFPAIILSGLSGILVPEISMARGAGDNNKVKAVIGKTFSQTLCYSVFAVNIMLVCGDDFGHILSNENDMAGIMIKLLAFVIPFIYLEIVLESIIKAEGLQKFSSFNYIVEYIVRISTLLVCVPLMSFYGIIISYYSSNIVGNISRIVMLYKKTHFEIKFSEIILKPVFASLVSWQISKAVSSIIPDSIISIVVYIIVCAITYYGIIYTTGNDYIKGKLFLTNKMKKTEV